MTIQLRCHPFSPYSQKILVALYEREIAFQKQYTGMGNSNGKLGSFALVTKAPVLCDGSSERVVRGTDLIVRHLDRLPGVSPPLIPRTWVRAERALAWDRFFEDKVVEPALKILGDKFRPEGGRDPHGVEEARKTLTTAYRVLERTLPADCSRWASGRTFTIADCAAGPALFFAFLALPATGQTRLLAYYERLRQRPSFARVIDEARPYRKTFSPRWTKVLRRFLPTSWAGCLAALAGGLSISALVSTTYDQNVSSAFGVILNYYDRFVAILSSPVRERLQAALALVDLNIELGEIWAHVAILCGIYLLRNVVRLSAHGRYAAALFQLPWALLVMLYAGIGADWVYNRAPAMDLGLVGIGLPLGGTPSLSIHSLPYLVALTLSGIMQFATSPLGSDYLAEVAVNVFPITGLFVMSAVQGIWFARHPGDRRFRTWPNFKGSRLEFFTMQLWYALRLVLGGMALNLFFTWLLMVMGIGRPAIAVLLILVSSLALYWMVVGWGLAKQQGTLTPDHGYSRSLYLGQILDTQGAKLGVVMLHTILVFLIFLLSNAGMGLRGL